MLLFSPRHRRSREPLSRRLDRAAAEINPYLLMIAIGLAVLGFSCVIGLIYTGSLALRHDYAQPAITAPVAVGAPGN
jgi:hypothetical protein